MTREEEIIEASQLYARHQQRPFLDGAIWADKHPTEEIQRLKRMFESDHDAYEQGKKDAFKMAYKWLIERYDNQCVILLDDIIMQASQLPVTTDEVNFRLVAARELERRFMYD